MINRVNRVNDLVKSHSETMKIIHEIQGSKTKVTHQEGVQLGKVES